MTYKEAMAIPLRIDLFTHKDWTEDRDIYVAGIPDLTIKEWVCLAGGLTPESALHNLQLLKEETFLEYAESDVPFPLPESQ